MEVGRIREGKELGPVSEHPERDPGGCTKLTKTQFTFEHATYLHSRNAKETSSQTDRRPQLTRGDFCVSAHRSRTAGQSRLSGYLPGSRALQCPQDGEYHSTSSCWYSFVALSKFLELSTRMWSLSSIRSASTSSSSLSAAAVATMAAAARARAAILPAVIVRQAAMVITWDVTAADVQMQMRHSSLPAGIMVYATNALQHFTCSQRMLLLITSTQSRQIRPMSVTDFFDSRAANRSNFTRSPCPEADIHR